MVIPGFTPSRFRFTVLALFLGFSAAAAVADAPPGEQATAPLTPEQIYLRAVRAMKDEPQPAFVTFRETVAGRNFTLQCTSSGMSLTLRHGDMKGSYDVSFRTSDGSALSQPVAPDANAKSCQGTLLVPAGSAVASLGVPQASPSPASAPAAPPPDAQVGPPIIGAVRVSAARYYHIELVGIEQLGTNEVYHLKLTAYREPQTHPLTDLYVDPTTFLVREARGEAAGHYVVASGRVSGIVDFDRVGDYWLVQHEHFDLAANALLVHARMTVSVDGSNFVTPAELPNVDFPTPTPTASPKPSRP